MTIFESVLTFDRISFKRLKGSLMLGRRFGKIFWSTYEFLLYKGQSPLIRGVIDKTSVNQPTIIDNNSIHRHVKFKDVTCSPANFFISPCPYLVIDAS